MVALARLILLTIIIGLCLRFSSAALPGGRAKVASWYYDGKLWLFGGIGMDEQSAGEGLLSDVWQYDPKTNIWSFEGGNKGRDLFGMGGDPGVYDSSFNPGGLASMCSWADDTNKLWLFGGTRPGGEYSSSVWKYDPDIGQWASMRSGTKTGSYVPAYEIGARILPSCVSLGALTYVSGGYGYSSSSNSGYLNDLWRYDRSINSWSFISGEDTHDCTGTLTTADAPSSTEFPVCGTRIAGWIDSNNAFYFTVGATFQGLTSKVFKFEENVPSLWTLLSGTGDLTNRYEVGSIGGVGKAWIFGGLSAAGSYFADLLEWDGTAWTKLSGPAASDAPGNYPNQPGTGGITNYPGSRKSPTMWIDSNNDLWLFGGYGFDANGNLGNLNDLWKFNFGTSVWTWVSGSNIADQNGNFTVDVVPPIAPVSEPVTAPQAVPISPPNTLAPIDAPIIDDRPTVSPTDAPTNANVTIPTVPAGLSQDAIIAISVVVPAVVVGAGLLILLLLLKKRKKENKKRKAEDKEKEKSVALIPGPQSHYDVVTPVDDQHNKNGTYSFISDAVGATDQTTPIASDATVLSPDSRLIPYASVTLDKEIGVGSFGKVYLGKLRTTKVAIKVANTNIPSEEFIREANFQVAIPPHPNIVQLLGVSVDGPQALVILEYCNEGSLDKVLFGTNKLRSASEQIALAEAIARGIDHLHQNNIVHRDLAVRNILLHHGEPKISDFGMSRKLKEVTQVGKTATNIGPLRWMAPEALGKQLYSTKSDVWSFGMILYEIVAHQEPHEHEDVISVAIKIRDEAYTPIIPDNCPPVLRQVMQMCWKMDPNERPDMGAICTILENNATG